MTPTRLLMTTLLLALACAATAEEVELMADDSPDPAEAQAVDVDELLERVEEEAAEPDAAELARRAAELNRALREVENQLRQQRGQQRRVGASELQEIVLPEDPVRDDYAAYIDAIAEATEGQNSFSSNDPQVEMLAKVPPEHIDLLVARVGGRSSLRFHAQYAMRGMDLSVLRSRINTLVDEQPAMIGVVVAYGWSHDARDAIRSRLEQEPSNLGIAWFQAATELNDPALYPSIHNCAVKTRYTAQVVQTLQGLADYDLERTVAEMWARSSDTSNSQNHYQVASVAAEYGHIDALAVLIDQLARRRSYYSSNGENTFDTQRVLIMRFIDFSGTPEEIAQWFEQHRDELIFDYVSQRYLLPEQMERFGP